MRVLVVGDIRLFRDGLAHYLRRVPNVSVAGVAKTRADAVSQCREVKPDIALVDMAMPESMRVVREIGEVGAGARVVALSVPDDDGAVIACAEVGIAAYVAREGSLDDLIATLHSVMRDEALVSPRIAGALLRRLGDVATGRTMSTAASPLTQREEEIAALVADGQSNKQIARSLHIRLPTVKNHVHNILEKLDVGRRTDVARRLARPGPAANPAGPGWQRTGSRSVDEPSMNPGNHRFGVGEARESSVLVMDHATGDR
ncbi:MAG: LuxR C-terminal-related transcriptional regulator [Longimicrobiales bacterium]